MSNSRFDSTGRTVVTETWKWGPRPSESKGNLKKKLYLIAKRAEAWMFKNETLRVSVKSAT